MSVLQNFRPFRLGLWGALFLLLFSSLALGGGVAAPGDGPAPLAASAAACGGSAVAASYSGTVSIVGGPLPASAATGVALSYNYSVDLEITNRTTGSILSTTCELLENTTRSGANGTFSLELTLPASHCIRDVCSNDLGPYGPVAFGAAGAAPAGYETLTETNGTSLSLEWVAELGEIALTPDGTSRTFSPNAPGVFTAEPMTAVGTPSPLSPTYRWNLTGSGWSLDGTVSGANATVESLPGAGLGELSVTASVTVGSNRFSAGPTLVDLESVPTTFTSGDANRTDLDVGGPVAFTVDGDGAPGYTYSALVAPGLGLTTIDWPCVTGASTADSVAFACTGNVTYPAAGVADPTVELTNTYSIAEGALPIVTVAPLPTVVLTPSAPAGYAGEPLPIHLSVLPGSGTPPFTVACLEDGFESAICSTSPGPNWTFSPVYRVPGTYSALAWIVDRDGTNRSVSFSVTVVPPLSVSPLAVPPSIRADSPTVLSAFVVGGDLPVRFWWNVSGDPVSVAMGRLFTDGTLNATWVPTSPGTVVLTLTVVDALGTLDQETVLVNVGPAVATSLALVTGPGAEPTVAGTAVPVAWQAEDLQGAAVTGYSETGVVEIVGGGDVSSGRAYINASGVGPLTEIAPGFFTVPTSAWELGRLSLTVTTTHAGAYEFGLAGPELFQTSGSLDAVFVADLGHLRFHNATVAQSGARANHTFWRVADEFGNPAPGAAVDIEYSSAGSAMESIVPVQPAGEGATGVWVNITAPGVAAGTWEVTDAAGTILLGPISIPAITPPEPGLSAPVLTIATAAPVGAVGLGLTAWAQRRRRLLRTGDDGPADADLRRMVEGRDRVIALVRDARALDLDGVGAAWGSAPAPPELADWVASLVADGTLGARTGPDGVARFCLTAPADGPPVVLLDFAALERTEKARRALAEEPADRDAGRAPGD